MTTHLPRRLLALLLLVQGLAMAADKPAPGVIVAPVRAVEFTDRIEALGTLAANESVRLTATVTETVSAIHFDDGDRVARDQVLVEMTSREEQAQLGEARATVNEAERQYRRIRALEAEGTAAKATLDERQREWETARARLAAIESRLADRLIRAPFAGVVGLRDLSVGALVQPGDLITTLDDDSVMKLEFPVPAVHLDALRPGLEVRTTSPAFNDRDFNGKVKAVDSRVDPVTRAVRVRALLPNPERLLRPGMLMRVELHRDPRNALVIPEEALVPLGRQQFVYIVTPQNTIERREIRIGARRPGRVEVLEGLTADERVVTHGHLKIRPGQSASILAVDDGSTPLPELLRSLPGGDTE